MKVLLVDDDADIISTLLDNLELHGHIGDCASSGRQAVQLYQRNYYDVIVLDIMMPGGNGLQACRELRELGCTVPIIFLTARDSLEDKVEGFASGGDDYLVKPFHVTELLCRIEALGRRLSRQAMRQLTLGSLVMDLDTCQVTRQGQLLNLPQVQYTMLKCLLTKTPKVVSREQLEYAVWGDEPPHSDALRSHLYQLRCLVDRPFDQAMIQTRRGQGYQIVSDQ